MPRYLRDLREYRRLARRPGSIAAELPLGRPFPILTEFGTEAGSASGQYFHQDLYVARRIFEATPDRHVDVASRIDGFVAHVAVFRKIEVLDIRPLHTSATNISFRRADITSPAFELKDYADSVSCLHAFEHFGLGRYGDPVDPDGPVRAWSNLRRMLRPAGTLYFSVPVGPQRVEFNAHRVFSVPWLLRKLIDPTFEVRDFALVDDTGELATGLDVRGTDAENSFGVRLGCGIFELQKR